MDDVISTSPCRFDDERGDCRTKIRRGHARELCGRRLDPDLQLAAGHEQCGAIGQGPKRLLGRRTHIARVLDHDEAAAQAAARRYSRAP